MEDISNAHHNLAPFMRNADGNPELILAHRLAATFIGFQTHSGLFPIQLQGLHAELSEAGTDAAVPSSFAELCERVEATPGVRFRALIEQLPQRAASPDHVLAQVLELARQPPDTDIASQLASWQPVIESVVVACREDKGAAQELAPFLTELAQSQEWAALSAAISRILAGERDQSALLVGLDAVDTAILNQILNSINEKG